MAMKRPKKNVRKLLRDTRLMRADRDYHLVDSGSYSAGQFAKSREISGYLIGGDGSSGVEIVFEAPSVHGRQIPPCMKLRLSRPDAIALAKNIRELTE